MRFLLRRRLFIRDDLIGAGTRDTSDRRCALARIVDRIRHRALTNDDLRRRSRISGLTLLVARRSNKKARDERRRNSVARDSPARTATSRRARGGGRRKEQESGSGRSRLRTGEKSNDKSQSRDCGYALGSKRLNKCSNFKITR